MLERKTITVEEAAKILGVSRGSAYVAVREGEIPSVRIGGRIVIPRAALERMLGEEEKPRAELADSPRRKADERRQ